MIPLQSSMTGRSLELSDMKSYMESNGFTIGGNWEYDHGCFDRNLDEEQQVWLRIPFNCLEGHIDSEQEHMEAVIKIGTPYVLRHVYNEGLDPDTRMNSLGEALLDQFQDPVNPDAAIDSGWVQKAEHIIRRVEAGITD